MKEEEEEKKTPELGGFHGNGEGFLRLRSKLKRGETRVPIKISSFIWGFVLELDLERQLKWKRAGRFHNGVICIAASFSAEETNYNHSTFCS